MKKHNRIVVITGGTSGIGKACKQYFESKGDTVVSLARNNPENISNFYYCDVSCDESVTSAFAQIKEKFNQVDVLINNAGYGLSGAIELIDMEKINSLFDVNFYGAIRCYRACLALMKEGAKIINMSSACALFPLPFRGLYCASKSALNMLTFSMNMETEPFGVKVLSVCPGDVKTNFTKNRVKSFETNDRYGQRITQSTMNIDSREDKRMSAEIVAKATYRYSIKRKPKPFIIVGGKYKLLYFVSRIVPTRLMNWAIGKIFGGKK